MNVTPPQLTSGRDAGGSPLPLEQRVLVELRAMRKLSRGVTVDSLARADTICQLLGAGDPYVAYTRLQHEVLHSDLGLHVQAAAASLGLTTDAVGHLPRLDAFGEEVHLEQRQARRYSDRGIQVLARLIATNWPTETVPRLDVLVDKYESGWSLQLSTARLLAVEMRLPAVTVLRGAGREQAAIRWMVTDDKSWQRTYADGGLLLAATDEEISVVVVWRGELWPKWSTTWTGSGRAATSESLGNKLMLRLPTS